MARPRVSAAGGFPAIAYVFKKGREAGGLLKFYRKMREKNACKTCALGMGGQLGGMVNEAGHFPEVCKKSVQAQAGDMAGVISEEFLKKNSIADLSRLDSADLEKLGRIAFPICADPGDSHFRRISWDEALDRTAKAFRETSPEQVFFYSSGRSSNEAAFLMQLVARAYGTANINNCSYYCHQASGVALTQIYGSGTASIDLEDLAKADLALVAGANPASNHPRLITLLMHLRRRGGKVIVINPLKELGLTRFRVPSDWRSLLFGSKISDIYIQPHIGSDIALYKALLKGVLERAGVDREFIQANTVGWSELEKDIQQSSWESLLTECGVSREEIDEIVNALLAAKRGIFLWAMGLTHHESGVDNILALANLALSRGWLGREGAGLLPIRGHSNVQGVGSMGVAPALKQAFAEKMSALYGIHPVAEAGFDTFASMRAAESGRIRAAFLLGGNLFSSNPDRKWAGAALEKIPFTVYLSTKLNEGHIHGRGKSCVILPVLARDEESQATTQESMFNYVRLSQGGEPLVPGEMRSEVEILAAFAERVLPKGRFDWSGLRSHRELRKQIAQVVPGFQELGNMDDTQKEFSITGRVFHEPKFATKDGKARFHVTALSAFKTDPAEFRLMTLRSEGQFNTVVYEREDLYRGNKHRNVVMLSQQDATRLQLTEGSRVRVKTEIGSMEVQAAIVEIRPGNLAMYYPEANALVPGRIDPQSKTPAFKSVRARIEKC